MKIEFIGAVQTVTGSMHIIEVNGFRLLLECGLFQGRRQESFERNRNFPFDVGKLDAMVLSHAHIDHSGNIPNLVRAGFQRNIYTTAATVDLCSAMLRDSAHIQEQDTEYVNKHRAQQGLPPVEPIYDQQDVMRCLPLFVGIGYGRPFQIGPRITLTLCDAGHILGSALVVLDIEEGGRKTRLLFTGDLGRKGLPILRDPEVVEGADLLMLESTYGNREHESPQGAQGTLRRVVNATYREGGKLIIPAFAVGRTQEIVYDLHKLVLDRKIPSLPVFVDSPLATNVTEAFRGHPECYDTGVYQLLAQANGSDPFGFHRLTYTRSVEESKELNFLREPAIIISASGMCEAGRILHHLKNNIEDPRNTILIAGWQAPDTLGRRILERQPTVKIFGEPYQLRAKVEVMNGYSAHADHHELVDYVRAVRGKTLKQVFLVHGEPEAAQALGRSIGELGGLSVAVPKPMESVEI